MNTDRINAVMAGVLLILGVVFAILGTVINSELLNTLLPSQPIASVDFLSLLPSNSSQLTGCALFIILMGTSLAGMTVFLYPVVQKDSEELAMGMVLFKGALGGLWCLVTALVLFAQAALGKDFIVTGADLAALQSMGNIVYQLQFRLGEVGPIFFLIGAVCLLVSFYRTRLVPRWLSVWGLIGVVSFMAHTNTSVDFYLKMVLVIQEFVMAVWLIAKGFNPSAFAAPSAGKV